MARNQETVGGMMAKVDRINTGGGRSELCVNLNSPVGEGSKNERDDVLLIQVLFKYISSVDGRYITGKGLLGLGDEGDGFAYELPDITGVMDQTTMTAIRQFQINNRSNLLVQWNDGVIEPAKYTNRVLRNLRTARLLSITYLHLLATDAEIQRGDTHYIDVLRRMDAGLGDMFVVKSNVDWSSI